MLPVVFYTGTRRWESLERLIDLIDLGEQLTPVIPALDPLFLNLSVVPAPQLETAGVFGWVLRLVQERQARPGAFQDLLRQVVQRLEAMPAAERLRWLELLSYVQALVYHERNPVEHVSLQQEIEASVRTDEHRQEISTMGRTIADDLIAKGRKEGRKEGREEGRKEGREEAREEARQEVRRQVLLNQLRERFGKLPPGTVTAIQASKSIQELETWLRRFAKARTLEEIGIDGQ